jgi:hypothetical protein
MHQHHVSTATTEQASHLVMAQLAAEDQERLPLPSLLKVLYLLKAAVAAGLRL